MYAVPELFHPGKEKMKGEPSISAQLIVVQRV